MSLSGTVTFAAVGSSEPDSVAGPGTRLSTAVLLLLDFTPDPHSASDEDAELDEDEAAFLGDKSESPTVVLLLLFGIAPRARIPSSFPAGSESD